MLKHTKAFRVNSGNCSIDITHITDQVEFGVWYGTNCYFEKLEEAKTACIILLQNKIDALKEQMVIITNFCNAQ